jgi:hypothetical protein
VVSRARRAGCFSGRSTSYGSFAARALQHILLHREVYPSSAAFRPPDPLPPATIFDIIPRWDSDALAPPPISVGPQLPARSTIVTDPMPAPDDHLVSIAQHLSKGATAKREFPCQSARRDMPIQREEIPGLLSGEGAKVGKPAPDAPPERRRGAGAKRHGSMYARLWRCGIGQAESRRAINPSFPTRRCTVVSRRRLDFWGLVAGAEANTSLATVAMSHRTRSCEVPSLFLRTYARMGMERDGKIPTKIRPPLLRRVRRREGRSSLKGRVEVDITATSNTKADLSEIKNINIVADPTLAGGTFPTASALGARLDCASSPVEQVSTSPPHH